MLHASQIQTNFSTTGSTCNIPGKPAIPLGWIIPDGTNQTLEEINEKKVANGISPGGGNVGAIIASLQNLELYYGTQFFLVDIETGEVFAYVQQQWRQTGLYCLNQPFSRDQ